MTRNTRTILLVDGSATMRYYHGILLKRLEYAVQTASSAEEALQIVDHTMPSLVITESALPVMSGTELIRTLKGSDRTRDLPIVVLAGGEDDRIRERWKELGCAACLFKPVEPHFFYQTIQAAIEPVPREHIRLTTPLKVAMSDGKTLSDGAERMEYATTISEGGLYLRTLHPKPRNTSTPVRIFIKDRMIKARAEVLYSKTMDSGDFHEPGMGMKFTEISEDDRNYLRHFIEERLTFDITIGP